MCLFYRKVDTDGNGFVSYEEFRSFWASDDPLIHLVLSPAQQNQVDKLLECFQYFDESKDGHLDLNEFVNLFNLMKERGFKLHGKGKKTFEKVDRDKSGTVEFPELLRYFIEKFGILDVE